MNQPASVLDIKTGKVIWDGFIDENALDKQIKERFHFDTESQRIAPYGAYLMRVEPSGKRTSIEAKVEVGLTKREGILCYRLSKWKKVSSKRGK